jgi:toxin HigB-1
MTYVDSYPGRPPNEQNNHADPKNEQAPKRPRPGKGNQDGRIDPKQPKTSQQTWLPTVPTGKKPDAPVHAQSDGAVAAKNNGAFNFWGQAAQLAQEVVGSPRADPALARAILHSPALQPVQKLAVAAYVQHHPDRGPAVLSALQNAGAAPDALAKLLFHAQVEFQQQGQLATLTESDRAIAQYLIDEVFKAVDCHVSGLKWLTSTDGQNWLTEHALQSTYKLYFQRYLITTDSPLTPRDKTELWLAAHHESPARPARELIVAELKALAKAGASKADLISHISRALPESGQNYYGVAAESLAQEVQDEPALRGVVAEFLFNRAIELESHPKGDGTPNDPHQQALLYAAHALTAVADDDKSLGEVLRRLPTKEALLVVEALSNGKSEDTPKQLNQLLRALNSVPPTPATHIILTAVSDLISVSMIADLSPARRTHPQLVRNLAAAWAHEWHPGQTAEAEAARKRDEQRLFEVLSDNRGAILWCTGSSTCKQLVREAFRGNTDLNLETVRSSARYPIAVPAIATAVARATVAHYLAGNIKIPASEAAVDRLALMLEREPEKLPFFNGRFIPSVEEQALLAVLLHPDLGPEQFKDGPWPRTLQKVIAQTYAAMDAARFPTTTSVAMPNMNAIANMVGALLGKTPNGIDKAGATVADLRQALSSKDLPAFVTQQNYYADDPDVKKVLAAVVKVAGDKFPVTMQVVDGLIFSDTYGAIQCPALAIETRDALGKPEHAYITNEGAIHRSGIDREEENGRVRAVFRTGYEHWKNDPHLPAGQLWVSGFYQQETSATHDANQSIDKIAGVGCFVGGVALPVAAAWTIYRNVGEFKWRHDHGLSISPGDPDARRLWLSTFTQGKILGGPFFRALRIEAGITVFSRALFVAEVADDVATTIKEDRTLTPGQLLPLAFAGLASRRAPQRPDEIPEARVVKIGNTGADRPSAAPPPKVTASDDHRAIEAQQTWPGQAPPPPPLTEAERRAIEAQENKPNTPPDQDNEMPVRRAANGGGSSPGQADQTVSTALDPTRTRGSASGSGNHNGRSGKTGGPENRRGQPIAGGAGPRRIGEPIATEPVPVTRGQIGDFSSKALRELFQKGRSPKMEFKLQRKTKLILEALDRAKRPGDMAIAGFDFHPLSPSKTRYSCTVDEAWRVTFEFDGEKFVKVDLEQYH